MSKERKPREIFKDTDGSYCQLRGDIAERIFTPVQVAAIKQIMEEIEMKKYITLEKARDIIYNNSTTNWFVESTNDDGAVQIVIKIDNKYYAFYYSKGITNSDDTINTKEEYDINLYDPTFDELNYRVEIAPVKKVVSKSHIWKGI